MFPSRARFAFRAMMSGRSFMVGGRARRRRSVLDRRRSRLLECAHSTFLRSVSNTCSSLGPPSGPLLSPMYEASRLTRRTASPSLIQFERVMFRNVFLIEQAATGALKACFEHV